MAAKLAQASPECLGCHRPMRRARHEALGGLCSACGVSSPTAFAHAAGRALGVPRDAR